jgi:hypothetical protein
MSTQQIDSGAPKLPRAGSKQDEPQLLFLDEAMDFVEKSWQTLDLIDDRPGTVLQRPQAIRESAGSGKIGQVQSLIQKVDSRSFRKTRHRPCALSGAPEPEQKEALLRRNQQPRINRAHLAVILHGKKTADYAVAPCGTGMLNFPVRGEGEAGIAGIGDFDDGFLNLPASTTRRRPARGPHL